jgi:hypothetical protein
LDKNSASCCFDCVLAKTHIAFPAKAPAQAVVVSLPWLPILHVPTLAWPGVGATTDVGVVPSLPTNRCLPTATDAMYQFSLDAYSSLFHLSLADSPKSEALADRIKALNDYHTYAVYKYAARGLFEKDKLLLSLQMCARILQASGQINAEEWQFFLQVGAIY